MMSEYHPDPGEKHFNQNPAPNKSGTIFLCVWSLLLSRPGSFACKYFLKSTKHGTEFELLVKHYYLERAWALGLGKLHFRF